jgi:cytoskeleton protein RodZ
MAQAAKQQHAPDPLAHYRDVGAHLREIREYYRLNVDEVAARLHIRPKYITALEDGRMHDLPGRVYTMGYLQSYAEFLGLDANQVIEHYHNLKMLDGGPRRFQVVEPNQRQGRPAFKILLACVGLLFIGLIFWEFFANPKPDQLSSSIDPVPGRLMQDNTPLVITESNRDCIENSKTAPYPPCYQSAADLASYPFLLNPVKSVMELN